jgi:hypothetical protein
VRGSCDHDSIIVDAVGRCRVADEERKLVEGSGINYDREVSKFLLNEIIKLGIGSDRPRFSKTEALISDGSSIADDRSFGKCILPCW